MFLAVAIQAVGTPAAPPVPAAAAQAIREFMSTSATPGLSVAAANREGILWSSGFGVADTLIGRPATAATRYQIASVTKVYTALLLAELVAEGRIRLDAPIGRYVRGLRVHSPQPACRAPTVRDLATHSAGMVRDMMGPRAGNRGHSYTREELLAWLRTAGLTATPGLQYKYSNFGYALLGAVIEGATSRPYRDLLRERVLEPLHLEATGFAELRTHPDLARSYSGEKGKLNVCGDPTFDFGAQAAASEIISDVEDVARFVQAHLAAEPGQAIAPEARELLFTPLFPVGGEGAIGLGWHYSVGGGVPRWEHSGLVNEFRSVVSVRPDVGIGVALAANGPADLGGLAVSLLKLLGPNADTTALDAVCGDYTAPDGTVAKVRRTPQATLTLEVNGAVALAPWGRDSYRITEGWNNGEWVRFVVEGKEGVLLWEGRRLARRPSAPEPKP